MRLGSSLRVSFNGMPAYINVLKDGRRVSVLPETVVERNWQELFDHWGWSLLGASELFDPIQDLLRSQFHSESFGGLYFESCQYDPRKRV